ncbi:MAG: thermonuclease family protein [Sneathiella sp.]
MFFVLFAMPALAEEATGYVIVLDAQQLEIKGERFRLYGITVPKPGHICQNKSGKDYDCGAIAAAGLKDLTAGTIVHCKHLENTDINQRTARCLAGGYDLSQGMVHTGWAIPSTADFPFLLSSLDKAKKRKHGLWRGTFELTVDPKSKP